MQQPETLKHLFPSIKSGTPALILAPMEGVTDAPMRALMAERGAFTFCVSEFLRISQDLPSFRSFKEHIPETLTGFRAAGVLPVQVQLLGGNPEKLAASARLAVEFGAQAIDLNFGCPAPTVNRHDGGATLLKYPERIHEIVRTVRQALPSQIPVSAKMRLGWESIDDIDRNAQEAASAGANWITIHARTKSQGYRPPVNWEAIGRVRSKLSVPVVANGDIWSLEDFKRCREITGCEHFMIGRSALANPTLPHLIAQELGILKPQYRKFLDEDLHSHPISWIPLLERFVELNTQNQGWPSQTLGRVKQWMKMALIQDKRKSAWFDAIRTTQTLEDFFKILKNYESIN